MRQTIKLKNGSDSNKLAKTFNVTQRTVQYALLGTTETKLADKIRYTAINVYDAYYIMQMPSEGVVPVRIGSVITHYFYGKTKQGKKMQERSLRIDTNTGNVKQYLDGKITNTYENISINGLEALIREICETVRLDYNEHFKN